MRRSVSALGKGSGAHTLPRVDRKWWTLGGACAGLFILMLDSTVVALALPAIRHDVDASAEALQWVMNG